MKEVKKITKKELIIGLSCLFVSIIADLLPYILGLNYSQYSDIYEDGKNLVIIVVFFLGIYFMYRLRMIQIWKKQNEKKNTSKEQSKNLVGAFNDYMELKGKNTVAPEGSSKSANPILEKENNSAFVILIAIIAAVVIAIGAFYFGKNSNNNPLGNIQPQYSQTPAETLTQTPATQSPQPVTQTQNLALEGECADQAAKAYTSLGYPINIDNGDTYTSHYNQKLGKCFIEVKRNAFSHGYTLTILYDANERKQYADFLHDVTSPPSYTDSCTFFDGSVKDCTLDDFNNFVKPYMEN